MGILVTKQPTQVIIKSRGRLAGKKTTYQNIEDTIVRLAKEGKSSKEISAQVGKHRDTVNEYIKKAIAKGLIERDSERKIKITAKVQTELVHQFLQRDNFKTKYPSVENWVDKRLLEATGNKDKIKSVMSQLNYLKVVCDTLEIHPYSLLAEKNGVKYAGLEDTMLLFKKAIVDGTVKNIKKRQKKELDDVNIDATFRNYLMACRNFAMYSGVTIPKLPKSHILSGKKVSFGMYAHIKLPFPKINECVKYLISKYSENSEETAKFIFYYLTGTRKNSAYKVETNTIQVRLDGWLECKVYEKKTDTTWRKLIPNDNPHFEIIKNYMLNRIKIGERFLFGNGKQTERQKNYFIDVLKETYKACNIFDAYFENHATHALRHVSAHYWLDRTEDNYVAVARIVGWKDVQTLILCYGEITDEKIIAIIARTHYNHDK